MIYTLEAGDGGLAFDLDGMDLADPIWTNGSNVRFESGYFQPFDGHARLYDPPSVTPYGVFPFTTTSASIWVYTSLTAAYTVDNSGTHTNITRASPYTATADTKWTGGALTSYLIFNNANDVPQSWDGNTSNDAADLANWISTWRCKAIRPLRNYLVAVNITKTSTNYPVMVKWSHSADPGALPSSWDETDPALDAGEVDLADATGPLVDVVPLGDLGIIYSTGAYHSMQYIGGNDIWRFTRISGDCGALSQNCAVQYPGGHVVLTPGDVVTHAGGAPRSVIDRRMRKSLFNLLDAANFARAFVVHNETKSEAWICIPEPSQPSCTRAYIWNYAQDSWSVREIPGVSAGALGPVVTSSPDTWATISGTWDALSGPWDGTSIDASRRRVVLASPLKQRLYLPDTGTSFDGWSSGSMYVERTGLSLGNPSRMKFVRAVRPRVDALTGTQVTVKVGGALTADGPYSWGVPSTYIVGTSIQADVRATGRYIGVKFESSIGEPWRCRSMDIEFEFAGER